MIDFSNNINFIKPSIDIDFNKVNVSKNINSELLLNLLEKRYGFDKTEMELFNGYSSAIYSILKHLKQKYCFIYAPIDLEYKEAAENLGYELRLINRFENLYLPIKDDSVVIFANPSFLDGTYYDLEKLFEYWTLKNATVIVDESLLDFSNKSSSSKFFKEYSNIYIIKDLSIYYSNCDLNIASIFSCKENIEKLKKFEPKNKLSKFDICYLEKSLKNKEFKSISNSINIKNRIEIEKILEQCKYVDYLYKSNTNSILVKLKNLDLKKFLIYLEEQNIKFADVIKYDFIDASYINIYVSSSENIKRLKKVIDAF